MLSCLSDITNSCLLMLTEDHGKDVYCSSSTDHRSVSYLCRPEVHCQLYGSMPVFLSRASINSSLDMTGASTNQTYVPDLTCNWMQIKLVMPVVGSNGCTAHAHIQTSANGQLDIQVQLPNGQVVTVDSDDASSYEDQDDEVTSQKGRVIDADWREVR